jgi:hypothetical protein
MPIFASEDEGMGGCEHNLPRIGLLPCGTRENVVA